MKDTFTVISNNYVFPIMTDKNICSQKGALELTDNLCLYLLLSVRVH